MAGKDSEAGMFPRRRTPAEKATESLHTGNSEATVVGPLEGVPAPAQVSEVPRGPIVETRDGRPPRRLAAAGQAPGRRPSEERPRGSAPTGAREAPKVHPVQLAPEPPPAPHLPEPVEEQSFAEMFAQSSTSKRSRVQVGQRLTAVILQIGRDTTFLDLGAAVGTKTEALIDSRELRDEHGQAKFAAGDQITGYVRSLEDGLWITTALPKGAQREALQAAREAGMPVEGSVVAVNKGGLEVDLGAGLRGFVPASQAALRFTPDLAALVGQTLQFLITQVKDRDIVLSRRAFLERESKEKAEALRDTLVVGSQLDGTVTALREFGVFVDLGGIEGLIPMSELSHRRVGRPDELLTAGQSVTVEVLSVEPQTEKGRERITLSLKRLEDDPWMSVGNTFVEGQRFKGKVVRLQPFGAFVELAPGIDGLVHVSKLTGPNGSRVTHPEQTLKPSQEVWVEIETLDRAARKIGLRPLTDAEAAAPPPPRLGPVRVGDIVETTVDKIESFGLFVRWSGGRGLLPAGEMGTPRGADLRRSHPVGSKIRAQVIEVDVQQRVRLSAVAAVQAQERAEVDAYMKEHAPVGRGFGTFADLLKRQK